MKIYHAPLQGYTEAAYRNAHATFFGNIDTYYTPFVRQEKDGFRNKDKREIASTSNEMSHLVPQMIGNKLEVLENILSLFISNSYKEVDINLGCPFLMLAKRHNGSGILPFPDEVKELLKIVLNHPEIDFSVKMRLGWEQPNECLQLLPILNEIPLKHITLHPRVGKQQYKGPVDLEGFNAFAGACRHPLIYNGDLKNQEDIERIATSCPTISGVMIGRGLLENPAMALEYKEQRVLSEQEMKDKLRLMHKKVFAQCEEQLQGGETQFVGKMKTFWEYLEPQIGHKAWKAIHKSSNLAKYTAAVGSI